MNEHYNIIAIEGTTNPYHWPQQMFLKSGTIIYNFQWRVSFHQQVAKECDLPGASGVVQLLRSQVAIRSSEVSFPAPQLQGMHRRIRGILKRFTLANLVGLLCSIMSESPFPKFVDRELDKLRQTAEIVQAAWTSYMGFGSWTLLEGQLKLLKVGNNRDCGTENKFLILKLVIVCYRYCFNVFAVFIKVQLHEPRLDTGI